MPSDLAERVLNDLHAFAERSLEQRQGRASASLVRAELDAVVILAPIANDLAEGMDDAIRMR
jgi:hypothetical protein